MTWWSLVLGRLAPCSVHTSPAGFAPPLLGPNDADTCTDLLGDEWCSGSVCCTLLARPPYDFCDSARATALGAEQQPGEFRSVTCPASCSTCSGKLALA